MQKSECCFGLYLLWWLLFVFLICYFFPVASILITYYSIRYTVAVALVFAINTYKTNPCIGPHKDTQWHVLYTHMHTCGKSSRGVISYWKIILSSWSKCRKYSKSETSFTFLSILDIWMKIIRTLRMFTLRLIGFPIDLVFANNLIYWPSRREVSSCLSPKFMSIVKGKGPKHYGRL